MFKGNNKNTRTLRQDLVLVYFLWNLNKHLQTELEKSFSQYGYYLTKICQHFGLATIYWSMFYVPPLITE